MKDELFLIFKDFFTKLGFQLTYEKPSQFIVFHPKSPSAIGLMCQFHPLGEKEKIKANIWLLNVSKDGKKKSLNQAMTIYQYDLNQYKEVGEGTNIWKILQGFEGFKELMAGRDPTEAN